VRLFVTGISFITGTLENMLTTTKNILLHKLRGRRWAGTAMIILIWSRITKQIIEF
jgi:hypothetical protein